ncbi:adenylate/guanylate cyclase domain-containing protein [Ferribacterium limneticum]|uniref:adenylate/guanylate cyclase domain-containing protein n=1 Tax=Ferribacterium limneticum TaxID=76259 RepID=UPI001CFA80BD|nr:adenylate/guanylate cyclase domain-containing protein [Ferribacterium limneticum]UCV29231.1 adenylate/guanylate cyclase domain-containing protein [Ferribacterium limneticum]UCV33150.1 adenylate/guanylate cyclase domain-containing protein [Ferribacterium limneticum]
MSQQPFLQSLRTAGINPNDDAETRLKKSLLIFATGLVCLGSMLWLFLYGQMGPQFSANAPFVFQLLLVGNLLYYFRSGNFDLFRYTQLALFLFAPFAVQWSIGNFITASGTSLWGLLAPIGAVLFFGVRESLAWFFAYIFLTALSGFFDYFLADSLASNSPKVSTRTSVFFFALNFAAISSIVYLLLRYAVQEKAKAQACLEETHRLLQDEQDRSERLLLNILPGPIAERLKHDSQAIADGFADVTVMFVDIVNFTRIAEGMTPQQVFAMLNRIFSSFDELAEQYGMEKIKTIGDAYMVAGGLNNEQNNYTQSIAELAIAMRDLLHRDFTVNDMHLDVRIGIGTGPVVAGVVGKKKFIYDLWGDTVNLASRITSEGTPGMIQLDATTYHRLAGHFIFDAPLTLHLKGKGNTAVYRLIGPQDESKRLARA